MLRIYNTLTRKKGDLQTLEPDVIKMYVCGVRARRLPAALADFDDVSRRSTPLA
jgi:hypothetical protein